MRADLRQRCCRASRGSLRPARCSALAAGWRPPPAIRYEAHLAAEALRRRAALRNPHQGDVAVAKSGALMFTAMNCDGCHGGDGGGWVGPVSQTDAGATARGCRGVQLNLLRRPKGMQHSAAHWALRESGPGHLSPLIAGAERCATESGSSRELFCGAQGGRWAVALAGRRWVRTARWSGQREQQASGTRRGYRSVSVARRRSRRKPWNG